MENTSDLGPPPQISTPKAIIDDLKLRKTAELMERIAELDEEAKSKGNIPKPDTALEEASKTVEKLEGEVSAGTEADQSQATEQETKLPGSSETIPDSPEAGVHNPTHWSAVVDDDISAEEHISWETETVGGRAVQDISWVHKQYTDYDTLMRMIVSTGVRASREEADHLKNTMGIMETLSLKEANMFLQGFRLKSTLSESKVSDSLDSIRELLERFKVLERTLSGRATSLGAIESGLETGAGNLNIILSGLQGLAEKMISSLVKAKSVVGPVKSSSQSNPIKAEPKQQQAKKTPEEMDTSRPLVQEAKRMVETAVKTLTRGKGIEPDLKHAAIETLHEVAQSVGRTYESFKKKYSGATEAQILDVVIKHGATVSVITERYKTLEAFYAVLHDELLDI